MDNQIIFLRKLLRKLGELAAVCEVNSSDRLFYGTQHICQEIRDLVVHLDLGLPPVTGQVHPECRTVLLCAPHADAGTELVVESLGSTIVVPPEQYDRAKRETLRHLSLWQVAVTSRIEELQDTDDAHGKPVERKSPGRPKNEFTRQRADYAKSKVDEGYRWPEIESAYRKEHPDDTEASVDKIRHAYNAEYPAK